MNAILLAAGYGTRLYPLTRNRAKALLTLGGRPIIDYLVDQLEASPQIERLLLVSNDRFIGQFERWAECRSFRKPILLFNDGSTENDNRLGAIADMALAIRRGQAGDQPAYVLATDNLPRFNLLDIVDLWRQKGTSAVFACPVGDPSLLGRVGVAVLDGTGRVVDFQEKPAVPKSNLRVPPFYVYTAQAVAAVERYLAEGNNPDAPGHFLAWLIKRQEVFALVRPEGTYEIGTPEAYRAVCAEFGGDEAMC